MFKNLLKNTGVQILSKAISIGIGLLITRILIEKLGVSGYGGYIFIISVFIFLDSVADFGSKIIGVRESMKVANKEEIWSQIGWLRLLTTGAGFVFGIMLIHLLPGMAGLREPALVALLMIWLTSLAGTMEVVWQSRLKMELKVAVEIMFPTLFVIMLWKATGLNLNLVFGMALLARVLSLILGWWLLRKVGGWKRLFEPKIDKIKALWKQSWPMGAYLLVFASYDRAVDSLIIERMMGLKEVAWYGLAYKIYASLLQPANFFGGSAFPYLSLEKGDKKSLFMKLMWLMVIPLLLIMPILYFSAPYMVRILAGGEFEPSILVLRILLTAMLFSYLGHLVGFTLISKNGQKEMLKISVVILLFNLIGNLWAISRFGLIGAAWVTVLTEFLSLVLMSIGLKNSR